MQRQRKFTPDIIEQIPRLVADGKRPSEIAGQIGCSVNALRVRCSQLGLSLSRRKIESDDARQTMGALTVLLSPLTIDTLRKKADAENMSKAEFVSALLEAIARDDLYKAVLDLD